jgi:hypothetical protein
MAESEGPTLFHPAGRCFLIYPLEAIAQERKNKNINQFCEAGQSCKQR